MIVTTPRIFRGIINICFLFIKHKYSILILFFVIMYRSIIFFIIIRSIKIHNVFPFCIEFFLLYL